VPAGPDEESLREWKKRQTRQAIADAAMRLFTEHGFDAVTISQIAGAARVSDKTVYNYFPRKTSLFFDEAGDILAELLHAVSTRRPGPSALDAVQVFLAGRAEWAAGRRPARPSPRFRQLIADSPALQAGMREMFASYETALAELLATETGAAPGSAEPFTAAVAMVAVIRAAFESGSPPKRDAAGAALRLLGGGLGNYALATPPAPARPSP
jgi:AcrR family transcriptional regulator